VRIEECRPISKRKSWMVIDGPSGAAPGRRAGDTAAEEVVATDVGGAA